MSKPRRLTNPPTSNPSPANKSSSSKPSTTPVREMPPGGPPAPGTAVKVPLGPAIPKLFLCPITLELMEEPTITACGHMFERDAITDWIRGGNAVFKVGSKQCPICNQPINEAQLSPCFPVKTAIADWLQNQSLDTDDSNLGPANSGTTSGKTNKKFGVQFINQFSKAKAAVSTSVKNLFQKGPNNNLNQLSSGTSKEHLPEAQTNSPPERSRSSSQVEGSQMESQFPSGEGVCWARLEPLNRLYDRIELNKDNIYIGRSSQCEAVIHRAEISGKHCTIYRVAMEPGAYGYREGGFNWDVFLADLSTNGTYVNGRRQAKSEPTALKHGDEISMGNRFTSQEKPELVPFIDWVFLGTLRTSPQFEQVERLKAVVADFDTLLNLRDSDLQTRGVDMADVRTKVLNAAKSWSEEHQLPVYRLEIVGFDVPAAPLPNRPIAASNGRSRDEVNQAASSTRLQTPFAPMPSSSSAVSYTHFQQQKQQEALGANPQSQPPPLPPQHRSSNARASMVPTPTPPASSVVMPPIPPPILPAAYVPPTLASLSAVPQATSSAAAVTPTTSDMLAFNEDDFDVGFSPATYMATADDKVISLNLRRIGPVNVPLTVYISTTDEGTARPGVDFKPVYKVPCVFPVGSCDTLFDFRWGTQDPTESVASSSEDNEHNPIQTVNFAVFRSSGELMPNTSLTEPTAVLIVEKNTSKNDDAEKLARLSMASNLSGVSDHMLNKVATVFSDINIATIHSVFYKEQQSHAEDSLGQLQDAVVNKLLWYRSLPEPEPSDLQTLVDMQKDRSVNNNNMNSTSSSLLLDGTLFGKATGSSSSQQPASAATTEQPRWKRPVDPFEASVSSSSSQRETSISHLKTSLVSLFASPTSIDAEVSASELEPFVLITALCYLRDNGDYAQFLNQNYRPFASHRNAIISSVCREVAAILLPGLRQAGSRKEGDVRARVKSATDQIMLSFMQSSKMDPSAPKLPSAFTASFAYIEGRSPKNSTTPIIIEDVNGLYDINTDGPLQSFYAVTDGTGADWAAPYAAMHLPSCIVKNPLYSDADVYSAILVAFDMVNANLIQTGNKRKNECAAQVVMLWIRENSIFVAALGKLHALVLQAKGTLIKSSRRLTETLPPSKIETLGTVDPAVSMKSWITDPNGTNNFTFSHSAKPRISKITFQNDDRFVLLASASLWQNLSDEQIVEALNRTLASNPRADVHVLVNGLSTSLSFAGECSLVLIQIGS